MRKIIWFLLLGLAVALLAGGCASEQGSANTFPAKAGCRPEVKLSNQCNGKRSATAAESEPAPAGDRNSLRLKGQLLFFLRAIDLDHHGAVANLKAVDDHIRFTHTTPCPIRFEPKARSLISASRRLPVPEIRLNVSLSGTGVGPTTSGAASSAGTCRQRLFSRRSSGCGPALLPAIRCQAPFHPLHHGVEAVSVIGLQE